MTWHRTDHSFGQFGIRRNSRRIPGLGGSLRNGQLANPCFRSAYRYRLGILKLFEDLMVLKLISEPAEDIESRLQDSQSPDEVVRGNVVRSLCPCHAGWDVFEQHVGLVYRLLRDPSHVVRAHALHVLEDAVRMQSAEDLRYYLEPGEEKIGEKRACYFRPMEERLEARRNRKMRKLKTRHRAPRAT